MYLKSISLLFCILVYIKKISALYQNFHFGEMDAFFWRKFFSPEIMVVYSLGHLEGLGGGQTTKQ